MSNQTETKNTHILPEYVIRDLGFQLRDNKKFRTWANGIIKAHYSTNASWIKKTAFYEYMRETLINNIIANYKGETEAISFQLTNDFLLPVTSELFSELYANDKKITVYEIVPKPILILIKNMIEDIKTVNNTGSEEEEAFDITSEDDFDYDN